MRTSDYPYNHNRTLAIWIRLRNNDDGLTHDDTTNIDPVVLESWKRCTNIFADTAIKATTQHHHFDVQSVVNRNTNLISLTVPYLEDIQQSIQETANAVFLTDHEGVVLAIEGELTTINTMHKIGMAIGERWGEQYMGTNAVGLSLITAMPTQVVGAEHFMQIFHEYGGSAAPIHDENGTIIGIIGILSLAERTNQSHLAIAMATAHAISNQFQSNRILEQANQRLRKLDSILESVADGVITWNTAGTIEHINSHACQILGVRATSMLGKSLNSTIQLSEYAQTTIEQQQELSDVETPIRIDDRIVTCLLSLRTIHDGTGEITGGIAMLRPVSQIRSLVNQQTSSRAAMTFDDFHFKSAKMRYVLRLARTAAKGSAPVLISGEDGVGKTMLAQAIHNSSPRISKPLTIVNCGMIPNEFMVEELLGVEAHSDQQPGRPSKFELADGGTLLFDQIDQLSLEAQNIVLNVMKSRHVARLAATRSTPINVRIVATTVANVEQLVRNNHLLPQLYYLFSVFHLDIPPLRERPEDILVLVERFLQRAGSENAPFEFTTDVANLLTNYAWPGNVRELENVVERATMLTTDTSLRVIDLPENVRNLHSYSPNAVVPQQVISLAEAERDAIIRSGWAYRGVVTEMSEALGINRSTLWRKLKQYDISTDDFKQT